MDFQDSPLLPPSSSTLHHRRRSPNALEPSISASNSASTSTPPTQPSTLRTPGHQRSLSSIFSLYIGRTPTPSSGPQFGPSSSSAQYDSVPDAAPSPPSPPSELPPEPSTLNSGTPQRTALDVHLNLHAPSSSSSPPSNPNPSTTALKRNSNMATLSPQPSDDGLNSRSSRRASVAGSAYSAAGSTRHMLADFNGGESSGYLNVPRYTGLNGSAPASPTMSTSGLSLSVNYLPSKFSDNILTPRSRRRSSQPMGRQTDGPAVPKQGGGLAAFKSGESRIGGKGLRWTRFKWILFVANLALSLYSLVALVFCLLTWFDAFHHADIIRVANTSELILSTVAASLGLFTSVIGWAGILMNNRGFLAWYALLTWVTFAFLVTPGYITYRKFAYNLEGKVNLQWSQKLGALGRMKIQNQLQCCGYYSPYVEATVSQTCYARSVLPGCKKPFWQFQDRILRKWWTVAFALVPGHILVMISALMCGNHVTYRFGKGMMPERYRLDMSSMAVIMDQYANQLAEQYGPDVAKNVLERSKSNLNLASAGGR